MYIQSLTLHPEARRHDGVGCGGDARTELVRHVDHAHPLHVFVGVNPFDEALLGLAISNPRDHEIGGRGVAHKHQ